MKTTNQRSYNFSPEEAKIIKDRISGKITESECSRLLKTKRQYVNFMVARFVIQMFIENKLIIK